MTDSTRRNDPGEAERLKKALLGPELDQLRNLVQRYGDDAALAESVHRVIVDVLRKAGIHDHDRVAEALAPMVVQTVAQEIPRQHGRIAGAVMPHAHRLLAQGARGSVTAVARAIDTAASPLVWAQRIQAYRRQQPLAAVQAGKGLWLEGMALLQGPTGNDVFNDFDDSHTIDLLTAAAAQSVADGTAVLLPGIDNYHWLARRDGLVWLVAARGAEGQAIGSRLARIFDEFCSHWRETFEALGGQTPDPFLTANMARDLDIRCRNAFGTAPGDPPPRRRPWFGYGVLAAAVLALAAWGGLSAWQAYQEREVVAEAESALQADPVLADLPLTMHYDADSNRIIVRGVVGTRGLSGRVEETLKSAMQGKQVDVLLIAPPLAPAPGRQIMQPTGGLENQVQDLYARLNGLQSQLAQASMQSWFAQQVIRFNSGTDYFDPTVVQQQIQAIAQLFRDWPPEFNLRIVGYSDDTGSETIQDKIALDRALTVMEALTSAGVPGNRLMAVGRGAAKPLSFIQGDESINRRVEFEVYSPAAIGG